MAAAMQKLNASTQAPPALDSEALRLAAEKEQKDKALAEKQDKRATIVVAVLRRFLTAFYKGRQQMIDAANAAEALKRANKGKKKGRKKKGEKKDDKKDAKKGGKDKKPKKNPVQEAWATFLADMDERISKTKRIFLEDMYRGVAKLSAEERVAMIAILTTNNKKILPMAGLNINQLNIKEALAAGCAACDLSRDKAAPSSSVGLQQLMMRAASGPQILAHGYKEGDLLRAGIARHEVVALAQHEPQKLRLAGIEVDELVSSPLAPELALKLQQGPSSMRTLRQAGFTAGNIIDSSIGDVWSMAKAGYSFTELKDSHVPASELRAAGFGLPTAQPAAFLGRALLTVTQAIDARLIPDPLTGTQAPQWQKLLRPSTAVRARSSTETPAGLASREGLSGSSRSRIRSAIAAHGGSVVASGLPMGSTSTKSSMGAVSFGGTSIGRLTSPIIGQGQTPNLPPIASLRAK